MEGDRKNEKRIAKWGCFRMLRKHLGGGGGARKETELMGSVNRMEIGLQSNQQCRQIKGTRSGETTRLCQ